LTNPEFNVANLVELQLLENSILRKLNEINSLRKNPELVKLQSGVESLNEKVNEINKILTGLEHERKKLEDTIILQNEKIKKNEESFSAEQLQVPKNL
jgi:predicted  nucleic acid-binding Zn-ribbon protein